MKLLLLAPLILGLTAPVQARPYGWKPALKVDECISATVQSLHTTWPEPKHDPRARNCFGSTRSQVRILSPRLDSEGMGSKTLPQKSRKKEVRSPNLKGFNGLMETLFPMLLLVGSTLYLVWMFQRFFKKKDS